MLSSAAIIELFYIMLVKRRPQDLLNISKFSDDVFSRFWLLVGMYSLPYFLERSIARLGKRGPE